MNFRTLIRRSLRFHWRAHLGVVLGAAISSAALIGALIVGDSVRETLKARTLSRLGNGSFLLFSGDRYFSKQLPGTIRASGNEKALGRAWQLYQKTSSELPVTIHPGFPDQSMLLLNGTASRQDSAARLNRVQVIGVSDFAPVLFSSAETRKPNAPRRLEFADQAVVNVALAEQLRLRDGDAVVIRFAKASSFSTEAPIAPKNNQIATLRLQVRSITTNGEIANFSAVPTMNTPPNIFVPLRELARAAELPEVQEMNFVNVWLCPDVVRMQPKSARGKFAALFDDWTDWLKRKLHLNTERDGLPLLSLPQEKQLQTLSDLLRQSWDFSNTQIASIKTSSNGISLASGRIFIEPPVVRAALAADTSAQAILTYLANLLRTGTNETPYSMVTAASPPYTPADMRDDEIVVNQWLADDLQVKPGDAIEMSYFLPESAAKLTEATNRFRVRAIVPMEMPWADRTLMPDFPGIERAETESDWDAGFPLVHRIRTKDEDYWKKYRGTPKAFVTLAAGQKMWANRFGNLTAIRFPIPINEPVTAGEFRDALEKKILATLKPEELGLRFEPVREQALKAAEQSQDFGQLFLGFSFFLITAALLLMALLFQFGVEQRVTEVGTLLALGFTPKEVRRLLLIEGTALALLGGIIGAFGGMVYARLMLAGLVTAGREAVGAISLNFHVTALSLFIGICASTCVAVFVIWLTLRKQARLPARELLAGEVHGAKFKVRSRGGLAGSGALICAVGILGWALWSGEAGNADAFFSAGTLLLIAGLSFAGAWLGKLARPRLQERENGRLSLTLGALAVRGCARRRKRSLATIALIACGCFVITAIGVFRQDATRDAMKRNSGTGGFALIGEATLPIVQDLNTKSGQEFFGLNPNELAGVGVVPFRMHEGDEASCLNLNRAQKPRLLGVKPESLAGRFSFAKVAKEAGSKAGWEILRDRKPEGGSRKPEQDEVPAVGDQNSIVWSLGKKIGDTIDYTDEHGRTFKLRLVGALANSVLQGSLIIDEASFVQRFPGESGYKMFLMDAPSNSVARISATLSRALQDSGLELTPAAQRLNEFNAVQNIYLATFQILGGLGLLLGSAGLGVVVLRNVLERRGELALLAAVGFRRRTLQWLVLSEHGALLILGLAIGIAAAAITVLPEMISHGARLPYFSLALTLCAVLANGAVWTWLATRHALRGNLLEALRNE